MIRQTFGTVLPPTEKSHVGDRFYNLITNEYFIFDDGQWLPFPESIVPHSDLPAPTAADAGKGVVVGSDGKYKLGGLNAALIKVPSASFAQGSVDIVPAGETGRIKISSNVISSLLPNAAGTLISALPSRVISPNGQFVLPMPVVGYMNDSSYFYLDIKNESENSTSIGSLELLVLYRV